MLDSNFPGFLKSKILISDIIGRSVRLIQRGKYKIARCPFHDEKTPSFHVNDERGSYHCFGCGVHGDVFDFLMQREGLDFNEVVKKLAEENGLEVPLPSGQEGEKYKKILAEFDVIYNINESSCKFFENYLLSPGGAEGLEYIKRRGFSQSDVAKFRIGFAPNSYNYLKGHLKNLGFSEEDMIVAGVAVKGEKSAYDKFRNRIMFPVLGDSGKVIAFSGRVVERDAMPKYMNSPETPLYHKSDTLFNYFFAKKTIVANRSAILVEGNIDVLSLYSGGIENVVAPLGTSVAQQQVEKLWKIAEEIIVCFDGDSAGRNASRRLALMVLPMVAADRNLKIVSLPENKDPDDMIKSFGKEYFLKFLEDKKNSLLLSEYLWICELRAVGLSPNSLTIVPEQKSRLELALNRIVDRIGDEITHRNFKNFYRNKLFLLGKPTDFSRRTQVGQISNYSGVTNIDHRKFTALPNTIESLKGIILNIEKHILYLLIADVGLVEKIFKSYAIDMFAITFLNCDAASVMNAILEATRDERGVDEDFLYSKLEKHDLRDYLLESSDFAKASKEDNLERLYGLILERSITVLEIEIRELALKNNDEKKRKVLIGELEGLCEQRDNLNSKFLR
ncbi:MAG: DNA primase [Rickettsiales bacterium]|jgi:DNA primase|nr:DNA primase [Rickettsiales bacterium]